MNLSGFTVPDEGRWALDPSFGSMHDSNIDIDNDPRAAYFRQMENGLYVRMALIQLLI